MGSEMCIRDRFFDVARIIRDRQPKAFVLENVKNLKSHDKGRTMATILDVLRNDLGYTVADPHKIDAQCLVPQHRERYFIVGFREDVGFNWQALQLPQYGPKLGSVLHPEDGSELIHACDEGKYLDPTCLLYTSPSPRDLSTSRMPSSA